MDVRLSDEQQALRASVAHLVGRYRPQTVPDLDDAERKAKLEAALEASGWRELRATAERGGPVASGVEVGLVAEELACGLVDASFLGPTLAVELRRAAGAAPARSLETTVFTPDLAGLAEESDGPRPRPAVAVDAGGCASALLLGPGRTLRTTRLAPPGPTVDLTRPSAVPVDGGATTAVGGGPVDGPALERWTALGLATACADLVGAMRGALELATEYAKSRRQFGVAVGSFQAVRHLLADALTAVEGSSSVARHAAWAVDALAPADAWSAAALAKAYCSRAARSVCEAAIQVHGGIGNTWDCLAHLYLRRALLAADLLGGVGPSLERVAAGAWGGGRGLR